MTSGSGRPREIRGPRPVFGLLVVAVMLLAAFAFGAHSIEKKLPNIGKDHPQSTVATVGTPIDPSAFASGACVAYPPTTGDRNKTVFLDAGHGGIDPGGVGTTESGQTIDEADLTLPVELDAMALLRADGFTVVVSRTGGSTVTKLGPADVSAGALTLQGAHADVAARDVCANDADAALLVGIYFDAGGSPQNAGSVTAYDADRPFSAQSLSFATMLQSDVLGDMDAKGWNIPNIGVQPDNNLGSYVGDPSAGGIASEAASYHHLLLLGPPVTGFFTTPSEMPGAVIEPLYLTDPFEGTIAQTASGQMVIATGIASAVEQFLAPPPAPSTTTTPAKAN